jgi:hypothetical protein
LFQLASHYLLKLKQSRVLLLLLLCLFGVKKKNNSLYNDERWNNDFSFNCHLDAHNTQTCTQSQNNKDLQNENKKLSFLTEKKSKQNF